jgi:hypothetical protein
MFVLGVVETMRVGQAQGRHVHLWTNPIQKQNRDF